MTFQELALFFGVSFIAAAINSVAGGGTFLTFPVFIMGGLTSLQANIMSTIALWPGTLASIWGYRGVLTAERKALIPYLTVGLLGGAAGAALLLLTPETVFKHLVPWLLLGATMIFTFGKYAIAFINRFGSQDSHGRRIAGIVLQAVTAVYGGYFGAGIGILTLAMLQLMGQSNIHEMNAMKTVLTSAINAVTAIIFLFSGQVVWLLAPVMVAGAVLGGYVGARAALRVPPQKVRLLVSGIGFAMSAYFFIHGA